MITAWGYKFGTIKLRNAKLLSIIVIPFHATGLFLYLISNTEIYQQKRI